jgi:hypothetical protein
LHFMEMNSISPQNGMASKRIMKGVIPIKIT